MKHGWKIHTSFSLAKVGMIQSFSRCSKVTSVVLVSINGGRFAGCSLEYGCGYLKGRYQDSSS